MQRLNCLCSLFSTLEIIFCAFLAENYFVKVLIPFIGVRSRYERTSTFFDPLVTAPYAVFDIQMTTVFFYSGLVCSHLLKPLNRNSERIPVFFLAGLASELKTDNIPYGRSFPAASGGKLQKLTLLTGYK